MTAAPAFAPSQRSFEVSFEPAPAFVSPCRRITTASLRRWGVPEAVIDNVVLVVSELVTNAIEHGGSNTALRVCLNDGELRIEVADGNQSPATLQDPADDDESGRGLYLVALLAELWGTNDAGATTWCTLRLPSEDA
ncbi:ATP-binding protein [Streptomyces mayonensis]|uniref:ATP-binding protein n=1 Tax=Streptomyces mayonensis TaxID=2750816 RepID=UPI001C1E2998|nr:ATP-binding protein [Streptomyces sp. A108]MBU6529682.1 ATP-binding protein [Streptomyces sp. A108]